MKQIVLVAIVVVLIVLTLLTKESKSDAKDSTRREDKCGTESIPEGTTEYHFPWADRAKCIPDFLFVGTGPMGSAALRRLADRGFRVAALTTGFDNQENDLVRYPFDVSRYQGRGEYGLNILNAVFDPSVSVFEGNPSGPASLGATLGLCEGKAWEEVETTIFAMGLCP